MGSTTKSHLEELLGDPRGPLRGDPPFKIVKSLGVGTYAVVYEVILKGIKDPQALKFSPELEEYGIESPNEVDLMCRLKHPTLMHAQGLFLPRDSEVSLIRGMGLFLPLGVVPLNKALRWTTLTEMHRIKIAFKLADAIDFLHRQGILHLDIKLANVILYRDAENEWDPVLTDFGLSAYVPPGGNFTTYKLKITSPYRSPEALSSEEKHVYSAAEDLWALGVLFLELFSRRIAPWSHMEDERVRDDVVESIKEGRWLSRIKTALGESPQEVVDLVTRLLTPDKSQRLSLPEVLEHTLFKGQKKNSSAGTLVSVPQVNTSYPHDFLLLWERIEKIAFHGGDPYGATAEILFLAGDLLHRVRHLLEPRSFRDQLILLYGCLSLALKIIGKKEYLASNYLETLAEVSHHSVTEWDLARAEIAIVQELQGILYRNYLFAKARGIEDLVVGYQWIRDPERYLVVDLDEWLREREGKGGGENNIAGKEISAREFLERVGKSREGKI